MKKWLVLCVALAGLSRCSSDNSSTPKDTTPEDVAADLDTTAQVDTRSDAAPQDLMDTAAPDLPPADAVDLVEDGSDVTDTTLEDTWTGPLPFKVTRPPEGEPLTPEEVTAFTKALTGFYKKSGLFNWLYWTGHGMHASYDAAMPDFRLFWQDTRAYKEGDRVRFEHFGGADNLALRTAKLLENAAAGYLMSGDPMFGRLVEDYCKGFVALSLAMDWEGEEPPVKYLQARAIFAHDHDYEMEGGRKVRVEYGPVKVEKYDWNAHTVPNDSNPHYGPIWIRNMRSKDDVPHMYRMLPILRQVAKEGKEESVRAAAVKAIEYMEGFARDIVDNGYQIRTKENGVAFVPTKEDGTINDLASFALYDVLIPNAECNAKYTSALLAYSEAKGNECGEADHNMYEDIAVNSHFFNLAIIRFFHLAALHNALDRGENTRAEALMKGLIKRADRYENDLTGPDKDAAWGPDLASWLVAAGTTGMPLTAKETRLIVQHFTQSAEKYGQFAHWDPWQPTTPDGEFGYVPPETVPVDPENPDAGTLRLVRLQEMVFALEYCQSPYRHPESAPLFDCSIIADPSKWGE